MAGGFRGGFRSPRQGTRFLRSSVAAAAIRAVVAALVLVLGLGSCRAQAPDFSTYRVFAGDPGDPRRAVEFGGYTTPILSIWNSSRHSLAFVGSSSSSSPSSIDLFVLAVVTSFDAGSVSRVVWEANRERPVRANATLGFVAGGNGFDRELVLRDSSGELVWSTGSLVGATSLELQESGNFVVLSFDGRALWGSFDRPTDTLVLGQDLRAGMRLESRDGGAANFALVMEPGGLVLYSNFSGIQEPYWIEGYNNNRSSVETLESARSAGSCSSSLAARFVNETSPSPSFAIVDTNSSCSTEIAIILPDVAAPNGSFIRLEADGNVRAYSMNSSGDWTESDRLIRDSCGIPGRCQPSGICSNGTCIECLNPNRTRSPWTIDCPPPLLDSCSGSNSSSFEFAVLPGMEYYSNRFVANNNSTISFEACQTRCLGNCSCSAFFYWEESGSCFLTDRIGITLQIVADNRHSAYVKVAAADESVLAPAEGAGLSPGSTAGIVVGSLFLLLVTLVPVLLCISKNRSKKVEAVYYDADTYLESIERMIPMRFCRADLEKITDNFRNLIGTGGFGSVYEGVLPDGRKIAVKKLIEIKRRRKRKIFAEIAILGTCRHWNLVRLLGFCDQGSHGYLVYELMSNGSLERWIYRDGAETNLLNWELRMGIVMGIARGLAYLHEECMEVHLGLTSRNVLLDSSFVAKISDYGLYGIIDRESESSAATVGFEFESYHPPEWLLDTSVTEKCDVYSFGVLLLEIISGTRSSNADRFFLPAYALELARNNREMEMVDSRIVGDTSESRVRQGVRIAFQCLRQDPRSRPSMGDVVQMLEGSREIPEIPGSSEFSWIKNGDSSEDPLLR